MKNLILRFVADAAREPVDEVAERHAELDLVVAGLVHVARHREDARAGRAVDAELGVLLAAHLHDVRHGRQRLDVVHDGRLRVEALDRGERRPDARHAALALERFEQRGLLAADVRARAAVHDDVEVEARAEDVLAEEALARARRRSRAIEPFVAERELAAQVDEREVALDRVRRDRDALDELVRIALDEHAVLERRRLAFVGVHHEVARERVGRQERPLLRGREAGAAAAAQPRHLHLLLHVGRVALGEHLAQRLVRARRERAVDRPRVVGTVVQPLRDDPRSRVDGASGQRALPRPCAAGARPTCTLDDLLRRRSASRARGTRSSPASRARRRTRRGTRPLRP